MDQWYRRRIKYLEDQNDAMKLLSFELEKKKATVKSVVKLRFWRVKSSNLTTCVISHEPSVFTELQGINNRGPSRWSLVRWNYEIRPTRRDATNRIIKCFRRIGFIVKSSENALFQVFRLKVPRYHSLFLWLRKTLLVGYLRFRWLGR